jgi:hypothetical protein
MSDRPCVFILVRDGVYRHEVLGVYTTRREAFPAARAAADREIDSYHRIAILRAPVGCAIEDAEEIYSAHKPEAAAPAYAKHDKAATLGALKALAASKLA